MIKRTGEVTMGIFGIIFSFGFTIMGIMANVLLSNPDFVKGMEEAENDPQFQADTGGMSVEDIMTMIEASSTYLIILGIVASIIGLLAVIFITKNRKPVLSGVLFIVSALIIGIGTFGAGFVPGILYLVSGIMALVRKPKPMDTAL
ncbi:putative integral membrane protein [Rossellomorea marisflavi]